MQIADKSCQGNRRFQHDLSCSGNRPPARASCVISYRKPGDTRSYRDDKAPPYILNSSGRASSARSGVVTSNWILRCRRSRPRHLGIRQAPPVTQRCNLTAIHRGRSEVGNNNYKCPACQQPFGASGGWPARSNRIDRRSKASVAAFNSAGCPRNYHTCRWSGDMQ